VALPPETAATGDRASGGEIRDEFEDIVEAKARSKREFDAIEAQRKAFEGGFENVAEAKAKAKQEFEAAEAKLASEAAEAKLASSDGFEDVTAVKTAVQARTVSECSSGSDQVFEDIETAKKQAQARLASLGSDDVSDSGFLSRKTSVDEIDLIKAQNRRNEQQAQMGAGPLRDPRSPLPPLPDDDDIKKTKTALEPPEKPAAACEKSPRSRRHLEQQLAAGNSRVEENLYEPPRPGGLPPDFPCKPPLPPPTHPGMRRHSAGLEGPTDMYGALWNEHLPPMLPEKKLNRKTSLERQDSRGVRYLSDESDPGLHCGGSTSSEPPPLPKGRPSGPPPNIIRSNSLGPAPLQAAGTFDPDAMKNLMEMSSEHNRSLLERARERVLSPVQSAYSNTMPNSMLRQHSVKGFIASSATTVSLKEREVDQLRQEIRHQGGVQVQLRKKDCYQTLALVDFMDAVW
jgi:hypothetical protein